MRKGLLSLVGAAVAIGAMGVGCGGDDTQTSINTPAVLSGENESCVRTNDCKVGLLCVNNRCTTVVDSGYHPVGVGGSPAVGVGGAPYVPPVDGGIGGAPIPGAGGGPSTQPVRLSSENESCGRTADCNLGLICISQICVKTAPVSPDGGTEGGTQPPPAPRLGARGESCQVAADCATGLICVPYGTGGSVCELATYGVTPTGNVCGAECLADTDCCEMPVNVNPDYISCADVVQKIAQESGGDAGAVACVGAKADITGKNPALLVPCFLYVTYCNCAATTWKCDTASHRCSYKPTGTQCEKDTLNNTWGGCPTLTRLSNGVYSGACNSAGMCAPEPTDPICAVDGDCNPTDINSADGEHVYGEADRCTMNECKCYKRSGCYRKCFKDIDCPDTYKCSTTGDTANLCVPSTQCTVGNNLECIARLHNAKAECRNGTCVSVCTDDYECNSSGANRNLGELEQVCVNGECKDLGCTSNLDCWRGIEAGSPKTFCASAPAATGGTGVRSAIVTGK